MLTAKVTSNLGRTAKICFWGSNFLVVFSHIIESECLRKCKVISLSTPKYSGSQWVNFWPLLIHFLTLSFMKALMESKSRVLSIVLIYPVLGNLDTLIPTPNEVSLRVIRLWKQQVSSINLSFSLFVNTKASRKDSFLLNSGHAWIGPLWWHPGF